MIIRITANHFCAGYDVINGNIAPIIKYMKGWSLEKIKSYCKEKNWSVEWRNDQY